MGTFISQEETPTLYEDKEPAPGQTLRPGWTTRNVPTAQNLTDLKNASLDIRATLRPLVYTDAGALPVIATGGTVARTAAQRAGDVLNVKDFGAVGDGVTDDTAALKAAFAYAAGLGSARVYAPAGTYLIAATKTRSQAVEVYEGTTLYGDGDETVFKVRAADFASDGRYYALTWNGSSRLRHFRVDGSKDAVNRTGLTSVQVYAVYAAQACSDVVFEEVTVHGVLGVNQESFGIMTREGCSGVQFVRCHLYDVEGTGIHISGEIALTGDWKTGELVSNAAAVSCIAHDCDYMGVGFYGAKDSRVEGGRYYDNGRNGINIEWGNGIHVVGAVCEGNGRGGIGTYGRTSARIHGCTLRGNNTTGITFNGEIRVNLGTWYTGSPAPRGNAELVEVSGCSVEPLTGYPHVFFDRDTTATTGSPTPDRIRILQPDAAHWTYRTAFDDATLWQGLELSGLDGATPLSLGSLAEWTTSGLVRTTYAGAGATGTAYTFTSGVANQQAYTDYRLAAGRTYRLRMRYSPQDAAGRWVLLAQDATGTIKTQALRLEPVAAEVGTWLEADVAFTVTEDSRLNLTQLASASTALAINYVNLVEVSSRASQADLPLGLSWNGGPGIKRIRRVTQTWNPPSVATGATTEITVTVSGAVMGDIVQPTFTQGLPVGVKLYGNVTSAGTVRVVLENTSGGAVDLASGTLATTVWQF